MPQYSNYRGPRRGREKVYEKISEEIIVENFPNIEKEIVNQVQEAQRAPYRINIARHILIKLTKTEQRNNIKSSKGVERPSSTHLDALVPSQDSRTMTRSPSPRSWTEQALGGGEGQGSLACCSPWPSLNGKAIAELRPIRSQSPLTHSRSLLLHGI